MRRNEEILKLKYSCDANNPKRCEESIEIDFPHIDKVDEHELVALSREKWVCWVHPKVNIRFHFCPKHESPLKFPK